MTSSGRNQGPSPFNSQNELPSPEHVLDRIRTLTGELSALEAEIYGEIADPEELLERRTTLEQAGAAAVLVDFKAALDQVRSILWFCESGPDKGPETDHESDFERATEMLRTLAPGRMPEHKKPEQKMVEQKKESGSFFERLDRVIDNYMQHGPPLRKVAAGRSKA